MCSRGGYFPKKILRWSGRCPNDLIQGGSRFSTTESNVIHMKRSTVCMKEEYPLQHTWAQSVNHLLLWIEHLGATA